MIFWRSAKMQVELQHHTKIFLTPDIYVLDSELLRSALSMGSALSSERLPDLTLECGPEILALLAWHDSGAQSGCHKRAATQRTQRSCTARSESLTPLKVFLSGGDTDTCKQGVLFEMPPLQSLSGYNWWNVPFTATLSIRGNC